MEQLQEMNSDIDPYVVQAIVEHVVQTYSPITYTETANRVGELRGRPANRRKLGPSLERIQGFCHYLGLPSLAVMVVNRWTQRPGSKFIGPYRKLHPDHHALSEEEIVDIEQAACYACKDWQRLLDYMGIIEDISSGPSPELKKVDKARFFEGKAVARNVYTEARRNPVLRQKCLDARGYTCIICEKSMREEYGNPCLIQVHHLHPLSKARGERLVDPKKDLIPVCPNCHAALHAKGKRDCYSPNEIRRRLNLPPLEEFQI